MKRKVLEMTMSVMLLLGFFLLSQEAASAVSQEETAKKIVIDAGHGGRDPGMVGTEGVEEKGINLAIAQKLENLLEENGFEVIMTRNSDEANSGKRSPPRYYPCGKSRTKNCPGW